MMEHGRALLEDFLRAHPPADNGASPLVVFDCDGTLVHGDTGEAMFYHQAENFLLRCSPAEVWTDHPDRTALDRHFRALAALDDEERRSDPRFLPFIDMLLARYFDQLAEGRTAKACGDIVRLWTGWPEDEVRSIARSVLAAELAAPLGRRTVGGRSLPQGIRFLVEPAGWLATLSARGYDVLIVSGSNRWIVEAVGERIAVPPAAILGIGLHASAGLLTAEFDGPITILEGKTDALRRRRADRPVLVFSDSVFDLPLFEYSGGLRVLVRPRNGKDLFAAGAAVRDERWIVIDKPTLQETS